ncbi:MAG: DUF362 domain-containing protein [Acidobacteria bacterium]|nr:DUF362 domain-containing protein [Acidobacteriota bacterium]
MCRRKLLAGLAASPFARELAFGAQASSKMGASKLAAPGLFPGRVIGVEDKRSIVSGRYQADIVKPMLARGMKDLTGADDETSAWKLFFQKGDRVGIKVNPVGMPHVISAAEVLRPIISNLTVAGVRLQDIVVYDRYRQQFLKGGFEQWLPQGVRWSSASEDYTLIQLDAKGYDRDHFVELPLSSPGYHNDERARYSFAANFITKEVDKLVNLCVLKDHQSAGVTLALKNLSHGLVNNVSRSHSTTTQNSCNSFIPAIVQLPVIRNKAVLHIMDGVKGLYHGGPSARPQFVWDHHTLYFATDPVAMDHVGWRKIDEKRLAMGKKRLVEDTPDQFSTFTHRQPEHVEIAGALGLGVWQWDKIQYKHVNLG